MTLSTVRCLSKVLTSLPGVGVRTAATLLVTVGDGTGFPTAEAASSPQRDRFPAIRLTSPEKA